MKADAETQRTFIESLAQTMRDVQPETMNEVHAVIVWLDNELDFLVDEQGVLKVSDLRMHLSIQDLSE